MEDLAMFNSRRKKEEIQERRDALTIEEWKE